MSNNLKFIFAVAPTVICLVIYMITLYPSVGFMDSGELATAFATFGIPHPTGYPLSLLIEHIFSFLPIGNSVIYRLNLLSAILTSVAVFIFWFTSFKFLTLVSKAEVISHKSQKKVKQKENVVDELILSVAASFSALCFGLVRTMWSNAIQIEVYALHSVMLSIIIYFMFCIYGSLNEKPKKIWLYLFIALGFSFANHMTTIFILTGLIYLYYLQYKENNIFGKQILGFIFAVIPGLLLYFVLMIRSLPKPFMNWSDPTSLSNLIYHMRGGDFSQLMFSGSNVFSKNLSNFLSGFPIEFSYLFAGLSLIGLIRLYLSDKKLFAIFAVLILGCLLYSLNYNIRDLQSYFTLIFLMMSLSAGFGLIYISFALSHSLKSKPVAIIIVIGLVSSVTALSVNFNSNDNHNNYLVEDLAKNTLNSLAPNSILLVYEWGYTYPATVYYQQVEKLRSDVKVFNVKFLSVLWYLENIKKYYPDIYENVKNEIEDYRRLYTDEGSQPLTQALSNLVKGFFVKNFGKYPMYCTYDLVYSNEMKSFIGNTFQFVPDGLVYCIRNKNEVFDSTSGLNSMNFDFRKFTANDKEEEKVIKIISGLYYDNASYHGKNGDKGNGLKFLDKAFQIKPEFPEANTLKRELMK